MVSEFQWKLIIAGSVGGACAFFSSVLVFAILACRHQRKLKQEATKRLSSRRVSTQNSHSTDPSDIIHELNRTIVSADLPLPIPPDGSYIQPAFGVGPFWMGQNSINHDSGCADLESNRTDSASFGQRSFSPLPRNGAVVQNLPNNTFPAMSNLDIDSSLSLSFDLLSPSMPHFSFGYTQNDFYAAANNPNSCVTTKLPNNMLNDDNMWRSCKPCCRNNNIQSLCLESRRQDCGVPLVELSTADYSRCQASMSSDSDDSDPIWIRRASIDTENTLTRSRNDRNKSDPSSVWRMSSDNRSFLTAAPRIRDQGLCRSVATSRTRAVSENIFHQTAVVSNPSRVALTKHNGYINPQETHGHVCRDYGYGGTISN